MVIGFFVLLVGVKGFRLRLFFFIEAAIAGLLARGLIAETIYFFYDRARPFASLGFEPLLVHPADPSFPSGHAAFFFALAVVVYAINRRWGITYFVLTVLVVLSRVASGVHWPTDILAGAAIGLACGWLVVRFVGPFRPVVKDLAESDIIKENQG